MKPSSGKAKGRRLQNLIAQWIAEATGLPWGKDEGIEPRPMGQTGPDVRLDAPAREAFPFTVECKNTETWAVHAAIAQAKENLYPGTEWLVVMSRNRERPVVIMDAEAWFRSLKEKGR